MVRERAWIWSQNTRISAFLMVFDLVQDNYYCLNDNCSNYLAGAAGLAGRVLGILAEALLIHFRIAAVLVLGFLSWVMHWES